VKHENIQINRGISVPAASTGMFSLRDRHILSNCPEDERSATGMLIVAFGTGFTFRTVAIAGALSVLNVPLVTATPVALTVSAGIAAYDYITMQAHDIAEAERTARRIDATDIPRLSSGGRRALTGVLRTSTALVTSAVTAGFLAIHLHASDIEDKVATEQIRRDAPLVLEAEAALDTERTGIADQIDATDAQIAGLESEYNTRRGSWQSELSATEGDVQRLDGRAQEIRQQIRDALSEQREQADLALCERAGEGPGCEMASGIPREGPRYHLANDRAKAAGDFAEALGIELQSIEGRLAQAKQRLEALRAGPPSRPTGELAALRVERAAHHGRLEEHDQNRPELLHEAVVKNPEREVLDPTSMTAKIWALGQLAHDPWFAVAFFAIKIMAFVLEMLPIFASIALAPGEYSLLRGRRLAQRARELRLDHAREAVADSDPMVAGARARVSTASATRPATRRERNLRDEGQVADLEAELLRKKRANEWFYKRTTI